MLLDGDVDYLRKQFDSSPEEHLFNHYVNDEGKTALQYLACNPYPAIINLLLKRGADPNHQIKEGRTPFQEAAPCGRYKNAGKVRDFVLSVAVWVLSQRMEQPQRGLILSEIEGCMLH